MSGTLREGLGEINAAHPPRPEAVRAALDVLRPGLVADGGNVELVSVGEDGTVCIELQGACTTCPASTVTVREVVEPYLRRHVRGVTSVVVS